MRTRHHVRVGRLIYAMNVSLDGFVETPDRSLDWSSVDDELHAWFNDHARRIGVSLYGRRLWELMSAYWPNSEGDPDATATMREFGAIWRATPKVVFASEPVSLVGNARLAAGDIVGELARARAETDLDIEVAGPTLAAEFVGRGLVDVFQLVVHPVILGAGTPFFPPLDAPLRLRLTGTETFRSGVVALSYEADRSGSPSAT